MARTEKSSQTSVRLRFLTPYTDVPRFLKDVRKNIVLCNEDSLFDADRIDTIDRGRVGPESVHLRNKTGNARVLDSLDMMLACSSTAFFPGTLLRDYGGYAVQVMPVIIDGRLIDERVKLTGIPYIDDERALAISRGYCTRNGEVSERHLSARRAGVTKDLDARRKVSLHSYEFAGERILPILCNELTLIPSFYQGPPVSLVVHSCANYAFTEEERMNRYEHFARAMNKRGLVQSFFRLVYVDHSTEEARASTKGTFVYEHGTLRKKGELHGLS